jgi:hypothetical protein
MIRTNQLSSRSRSPRLPLRSQHRAEVAELSWRTLPAAAPDPLSLPVVAFRASPGIADLL